MTRNTKKRICIYGTLGAIVALFFLNPCGRQMVFGPRVHGQPLAYWQDRYRRAALGSGQQSPATLKLLRFVGIDYSFPLLLDEPEMLPVLLSLLDDPNPVIRASLCPWLAKQLDSPEANNGLMGMLDDATPSVRAAAVLTLIKHKPALAKLRDRLADQDTLCRVRAAYAVCKIEERPDKEAVATLRSGLKVDDISNIDRHQPSACLEAVKYLCFLSKDNPEYIVEVADAFRENPQLHQGYGIQTLMCSGPGANPILVQLLGDADPETRVYAAAALGEFGPRAAVALPALVRALDDPDLGVRNSAAQALSRISPEPHPEPKARKE